jgi:CTP synthase (UTP-ammonia lyase)
MPSRRARLALIGDRSPSVQAHARIPDILAGLQAAAAPRLDADWIRSDELAGTDLGHFDGIWVLPGSPYADTSAVLAAIGFAREQDVPFLGTCGGFQHMLLELARTACGLDVAHAESEPDAVHPLIRPLACSLLGEERHVHVVPGTRAASILGSEPRTERYFCSYGLDEQYLDALCAAGLVIGGRDDAGDVRLAELPALRFYLGSLFQPELSSSRGWVHPLIRAFAAAAVDHHRSVSRQIPSR